VTDDAIPQNSKVAPRIWIIIDTVHFDCSVLFEKENDHSLHGAGGANVRTHPFSDAREFPKKSHDAFSFLLAGGLVVLCVWKEDNIIIYENIASLLNR